MRVRQTLLFALLLLLLLLVAAASFWWTAPAHAPVREIAASALPPSARRSARIAFEFCLHGDPSTWLRAMGHLAGAPRGGEHTFLAHVDARSLAAFLPAARGINGSGNVHVLPVEATRVLTYAGVSIVEARLLLYERLLALPVEWDFVSVLASPTVPLFCARIARSSVSLDCGLLYRCLRAGRSNACFPAQRWCVNVCVCVCVCCVLCGCACACVYVRVNVCMRVDSFHVHCFHVSRLQAYHVLKYWGGAA